MLAIRLQRTGRKGLPMYRIIVQEAHRQPTSGRVVANLGHYNPHTKEIVVNKEQAEQYLSNGAQPSDRVVKLFASEKVSLPNWVKLPVTSKQKTIKNTEKLRKNQPKQAVVDTPEETDEVVAETQPEEATSPETVTEAEAPVQTDDATESKEEAPTEYKETAEKK